MNEENIYIEKLKTDAHHLFLKSYQILNKQTNSNNNVKNVFLNFLFSDLIKNIDISNINTIDVEEIIDNNKIILYNFLENIYNTLFETEKNLINDIQLKLNKQIMDIKNKITECNNNLKVLKNIYINLYISSYFPTNNKINLNFENKKVLYIEDSKSKLILGEFFTKFLFNLIISEITGMDNIDNLFKDFYDDNFTNNYMKNEGELKSFHNISINFKYWILLLFIIEELFKKNSNFNTIFNNNEFDKFLNDVLLEDIRREELKKKKETPKKKQGGKPNTKELPKKKNEEIKSNTLKITNYRKTFDECFKKIMVMNNISDPNYTKLENIYVKPFDLNMKKLFKNQFDNIVDRTKINPETKLINPFTDKPIAIKNLYKLSDTNKTNNTIKLKIDDLKFDIYEFLYLLKDINNREEINDFLNNLKIKLILLLFNLYSIKKNIYENYIQSVSEIFNINNKPIKKENNSKINKNTANNYKKEIKNLDIIIYNKNKEENLNYNQKEIKNLEHKIKLLKKKNNINSNLEIVQIENEIKKKLIEKYKKI